MATEVVLYGCGDYRFHIRAPGDLVRRLAAFCIEASPKNAGAARCERAPTLPDCVTTIDVAYGSVAAEVIRDRKYPYDRLEVPVGLGSNHFSYYRYDTHVRHVEFQPPRSYVITSHVRADENAVLIPLKDWLQHELRRDEALLHASCVARGDKGLLIVSNSGGGKSVATARLLAAGCAFVGDEVVLVQINQDASLTATFVPQAIFARFSLVRQSPLATYLGALGQCCATQLTDEQSIEEMISRSDMSDKGGLTLSPRSFCDCLGAPMRPSCVVERIVLLERVMYTSGIHVRPVSCSEGLRVAFAHQQAQRYLRPWYARPIEAFPLDCVRVPSIVHVRHGGDLLAHDELAAVLTDSLG